jgi:Transposase DDE domain
MQLPLTDPDTLFEELLQDLPPEIMQMARDFKAFVRAKKVKTPGQLLRVVFLYCGWDKSLREVAGTFTALYESMTDQAVAERLRACGPWVQAMRRRMLPLSTVDTLPPGRRFVVIDASSIQAPGATGTDYRLHIAMDLVSLQFLEVLVSAVHTGETLKHFTLAPGDVALADRGYAHCQGMSAAVQQGADLIVRLNPCSVVLGDAAGAPLELCATLKRQRLETLRTLAVALCATGGQHAVRGWVHAYRLNAEQANRARHKCRQGHKKGTPTAESLWLAGWVLGFTTLVPAVLSPQTIMTLYRCRWQVEIAIKRWKSVLDVDALRAKAHSPLAAVWLHGKWLYALRLERRMRRQLGEHWGRLDQERVGTWWRVWGMLKDEIAPMITGALFWKEDSWAACLKVLMERPRRRTLQQ